MARHGRKIRITLASAKGHACISSDGTITIFLGTLGHLLTIPWEDFPFNSIELLLEELVVHELIHEIAWWVKEDWIIDGWHMLLCRLVNEMDGCACTFDCYFRDALAKKPIQKRLALQMVW